MTMSVIRGGAFFSEGVRVHMYRAEVREVRKRGRLEGEWARGACGHTTQREGGNQKKKSGSSLEGEGPRQLLHSASRKKKNWRRKQKHKKKKRNAGQRSRSGVGRRKADNELETHT